MRERTSGSWRCDPTGASNLGAVLDEIRSELRQIRKRLTRLERNRADDRWLRPKALPWSRSQVHRLIENGKLKARRVGRTVLVERESFERLLEIHDEVTATKEIDHAAR